MPRSPHAPHRLAHLRAARPEEAVAELRAVLTAAGGDVAAAARRLGVTRVTVHRWVTGWGLRAWLGETWPRGERARRALTQRKDRAMFIDEYTAACRERFPIGVTVEWIGPERGARPAGTRGEVVAHEPSLMVRFDHVLDPAPVMVALDAIRRVP